MRRILLVLSAAAVMAAITVASALPAFAHSIPNSGCGYRGVVINSVPPGSSQYDRNADGIYCGNQNKDGMLVSFRDNHAH